MVDSNHNDNIRRFRHISLWEFRRKYEAETTATATCCRRLLGRLHQFHRSVVRFSRLDLVMTTIPIAPIVSQGVTTKIIGCVRYNTKMNRFEVTMKTGNEMTRKEIFETFGDCELQVETSAAVRNEKFAEFILRGFSFEVKQKTNL